MKKVILNLFLLGFFFSCQKSKKIDEEKLLEFIIKPVGISSEAYLVSILNSGKLEVIFGEAKLENDVIYFQKILSKKSTLIDKNNFFLINNLNQEILKLKEIESSYIKKGGWQVILKTNGKKYKYYIGDLNNTPLSILINLIIEVSPMKITIHSWS